MAGGFDTIVPRRGTNCVKWDLVPEGVLRKQGAEMSETGILKDAWIRIEQSAKEFASFEEGEDAWDRYYRGRESELTERMLFVEDESGEKVATACAMYDVFGRDKIELVD